MRTFEIAGHREHHLAKVTPRRKPGRSVHVEMFDREHEPPEQFVKLTRPEASRIIAMLAVARPHLASPLGVDEAVRLLGGKR